MSKSKSLKQISFDLSNGFLTIDEISRELKVSDATVRNWIKTGYLLSPDGRTITRDSFDFFKSNVAGSEKLTKRANKSLADSHDHDELKEICLSRISNMTVSELERAGEEYEGALSNSYRNKEGVYYTPAEIAKKFFEFCDEDVSDLTFCDPCCGSGNFIIEALKTGFSPKNVFGFDVDPVAVEITKARVRALTGYDTNNIHVGDFLELVIAKNSSSNTVYDVIFTNPPWGKKIEPKEKERVAQALSCPKTIDSSAIFFCASLNVLKPNGTLGMLLPEAFFNVAAFQSIRETVASRQMLGFIDFGKPFEGLLTKAKGVILKNHPDVYGSSLVKCVARNQTYFRSQESFANNPKCIFNFSCNAEESAVIEHIYSKPHIRLENNARWALGIVTGNNKKFVKPKMEEGYIAVYKGSEIYPDLLPDPTSFIPRDLSLYQQVAPPELYFAPEKLIYRFISSKLVFHHDKKQTLFLNSANMFVLHDTFPTSHENVCWLLNTKIINWVFEKTFETFKVLRSDLESLPIFNDFFEGAFERTETALISYLGLEEDKNGAYRIKE